METLQKFEAVPFLDLKCGLAESPFWESEENVLRFVDIVKKAVYRVDLTVGEASLKKQQYADAVCVTADLASSRDKFLFGGKYGIGIGGKRTGSTALLHSFWSDEEKKTGKHERMRANDGAVDSRGRFWVGTLCDPETTTSRTADGVLFRLDTDGQLHRVLTSVTIPNGVSWSMDNKTMYFTDTAEKTIFAYDFDENTGGITNKRPFFKINGEGGPDGHAQDEYGNLWVAIWGAWKVVRVNPQGQITGEIRVPTRCPTAVAFAGEDVYITCEEEQEPDRYPEALKYHGGVFKCHVGVQGRELEVACIRT